MVFIVASATFCSAGLLHDGHDRGEYGEIALGLLQSSHFSPSWCSFLADSVIKPVIAFETKTSDIF